MGFMHKCIYISNDFFTTVKPAAEMMQSMGRWCGKTAIVTGAASGFGKAIAATLVRNALKVVGLDLNAERIKENAEELKRLPGKLFGKKADVTIEEDVVRVFDWAENNVGPIHILINNAGILMPGGLTDGEISKWKKTLDVNVLAVCICTKEAIKRMRSNGIDGHIVHMDSITGHYVPHTSPLNIYPATKHAVTALVESLRQELNMLKSKIKISSVSPGFAGTELGKSFPEDHPYHKTLEGAPLTAQNVADCILFILSTPPEVLITTMVVRGMGETC